MPLKYFRNLNENEALTPSPRSIFGSYDVRGSYPDELDEKTAYYLGPAVAYFLGSKHVAVGHDSRLSSPALQGALVEGLREAGIEVIDCGLASTPFMAWASRTKRCDAIMVTASHNEPPLNGFKVSSGKTGNYVSRATGLIEVEHEYEKLKRFGILKNARGALRRAPEWREEYKKILRSALGKVRGNARIALDYSHGVGGLELTPVLERLNLSFVTINETPDGRFPSHGPNPLKPESQRALAALLKKGKYSFGVIFDGDGDRVLFLDERGMPVSAAVTASLIADFYIPKIRSPRNVVTVLSFSRIFSDVIRRHKGKLHVSAVGRTNVANEMIKSRAYLGAENSGHYFFKEFGYLDSGAFTLLKVLSIVNARGGAPLSKLIEPYKGWIMKEESLAAAEGDELEVLRALGQRYMGGKISKLDGLTIEFRDWWFNIRRSNTEPVWRLTVEGREQSEVNKRTQQIEEIVKRLDVRLDQI